MKIQSLIMPCNNYHKQAQKSIKYLSDDILDKVPEQIKRAIINAVDSAKLQEKDKLFLPISLITSAEMLAKTEFNCSVSKLTIDQWKQLVNNTLNNIKDHKAKLFLQEFISSLI